jgi:hypothetical protein
MCELANLCSAAESVLKFAIIHDLKLHISLQATQAKPRRRSTKMLEVARLAELMAMSLSGNTRQSRLRHLTTAG